MVPVLMVCAHPDDEAVGCGGTLRGHVVDGCEVHVINLTSGEAGGHSIADAGGVREREAQDAAAVLGLTHIAFWREPDGALRATRKLVARLATEIQRIQPGLVYVPHDRDDHPDHKAASRLTRNALQMAESPAVGLQCEIWTPIDHIDHIVDISPHLDTKLAAIRAYRSQCEVMRLDESFRGLARYRGEMHLWPGGDFAEVFRVL